MKQTGEFFRRIQRIDPDSNGRQGDIEQTSFNGDRRDFAAFGILSIELFFQELNLSIIDRCFLFGDDLNSPFIVMEIVGETRTGRSGNFFLNP